MQRDQTSSSRYIALGLTVAVSVSVFAVIAFLPLKWVVHNQNLEKSFNIESVTVLQPMVTWLLSLASLGCFCGLLVFGVLGIYRRAIATTLVAFLTALLCPFACCTSFVRNLPQWVVHNELKASDGSIYYFAESSFLQGQILMLARLREQTTFTRTFEPLVVTNGDHPRSYLRIVRPAGAENTVGQLYLTDGNWLLGLGSANECYFAYDLGAKRAYGHGDVEALSPFLALGNATEPHEPDVVWLLNAGNQAQLGFPKRESIQQGLKHPNPRVREIASKLLGEKR